MPGAPRFDRPRDVRADEKGQREHEEGVVVLPLVHLDQPVQPPDCLCSVGRVPPSPRAFRGGPGGPEPLLHIPQQRRFECPPLNQRQQPGERVEVARDGCRTVKDVLDAAKEWPREQRLRHENDQQRCHVAGRCNERDGCDNNGGEQAGAPGEPRWREQSRVLRPSEQRLGMHVGSDVERGAPERFPQIQCGRQLGDGALPRADLLNSGGRFQPCGKRFLPRRRSRNGQELEQRAAAEQVQIVRVQVVFIGEAIARVSSSDPAILDPRQATFVERDSAARRREAAKDPVVDVQEQPKRQGRGDEQPGRRVSADSQDDKDDCHRENRQSGIRQVGVPAAPSPFLRAPFVQPLGVFGGGGRHSPA